ncbi:U3 small nucleolar RNA-associated protein 6 homolog [Sycon ciliatum]|uniref:U3 small nucleolar RNA-associated protein 6 homolog n=1 Tax=Sycon ciliatum TaxID=27933 RepID=UPI0020AC6772|eukprot:scpid80723/ scgid14115/ U3 small nucleolar RNA-associated protein 6 homolog; Multiple hat domains protein
MAELVNRHVESMLPELEEYSKNNIFSSDEIRLILRKRSMFEYRCQRRIVKKTDFLHYIQYEIYVDRLRFTRCKLRRVSGAAATPNSFAIVQRIHRLFRSALQKFKGDLCLWLQYIKFCKVRHAPKKLQQAVQDALKFHSYSEGLWVLAAQCDFERDDIDSARLTMMAALRAHPKSHKIWLEYCRMELLHVDKLRKRYVLTVAPSKKSNRTHVDEEKLLEGEQFSCKVADQIYHAAAKRIEDVAVHVSFLSLFLRFSFAQKSCDAVYAKLAEQYPDHPVSVNARCNRPLASQTMWSAAVRAERECDCDQLFRAALDESPSVELWEFYCRFWFAAVEHHRLRSNTQSLETALRQMFTACQLALDRDSVSLSVGRHWLDQLLLTGHPAAAIKVMDSLLTKYSDCEELWLKRLQLELSQPDSKFAELVEASQKSVELEKSPDFQAMCKLASA